MSELDRQFIFIDRGESGDEPTAVGPFTTEDQAMTAGEGRDVMALWSFSAFMDSQNALDEDDDEEIEDEFAWVEPVGYSDRVYGPYPDEIAASNAMDDLGVTDEHYKIVFRTKREGRINQIMRENSDQPNFDRASAEAAVAAEELRDEGWESVADDLAEGVPAETVLSRLRSIGEGDSAAATIVGRLT